MTTKRTVLIRNARIVPAETIWPGRCKPDDAVLLGELVTGHPVLVERAKHGMSAAERSVRTSLIVNQDLANRRIETMNTIYEVVL